MRFKSLTGAQKQLGVNPPKTMQNKILYRSGKFYALRLPDEPSDEKMGLIMSKAAAWRAYREEVELLMENPPEIVNPESVVHTNHNGQFINGDIFDLLSNMRFEEHEIPDYDGIGNSAKVVRIVKAETKDYIPGFKESIPAHEFKKECLNEPEPEESQREQ